MKIGFIGLGNVGGKLAGSLLRNKFDLTIRDLDENLTKTFNNLLSSSTDILLFSQPYHIGGQTWFLEIQSVLGNSKSTPINLWHGSL